MSIPAGPSAPPRVLVLSWSQTGQVERAAAALAAPLAEAGIEVVHHRLEPVTPFPFPWSVARFFGALPETVLHRPAPIRPLPAIEGDFDLVVVAGQVWFLSPSQPITALLQGPDRGLFRGKRVLTLVVCRNMWIRAWRQLRALVEDAGGRVTDRIVVTHSGRVMASYFTTLFWVITGRRDAVRPLGKAEVAEASYARVEGFGRVLAERLRDEKAGLRAVSPLLADRDTAEFSGPHAFGEQIGGALYPALARVVAAAGPPGSAFRTPLAWVLLAIVLGLIFGLMIPCFSAWFLFGGPIRRWLLARSALAPAAVESR